MSGLKVRAGLLFGWFFFVATTSWVCFTVFSETLCCSGNDEVIVLFSEFVLCECLGCQMQDMEMETSGTQISISYTWDNTSTLRHVQSNCIRLFIIISSLFWAFADPVP